MKKQLSGRTGNVLYNKPECQKTVTGNEETEYLLKVEDSYKSQLIIYEATGIRQGIQRIIKNQKIHVHQIQLFSFLL